MPGQERTLIKYESLAAILAAVDSGLARLLLPARTLAVFEGGNNQSPYFDNVEDAVEFAVYLEASRTNPVTIRLFSDDDKNPYNLDGYDYYDLYDDGIIIESAYDVWQKFIFAGGDLNLSNLLYDVKLERARIEVAL